jgi:hypothetical protein
MNRNASMCHNGCNEIYTSNNLNNCSQEGLKPQVWREMEYKPNDYFGKKQKEKRSGGPKE